MQTPSRAALLVALAALASACGKSSPPSPGTGPSASAGAAASDAATPAAAAPDVPFALSWDGPARRLTVHGLAAGTDAGKSIARLARGSGASVRIAGRGHPPLAPERVTNVVKTLMTLETARLELSGTTLNITGTAWSAHQRDGLESALRVDLDASLTLAIHLDVDRETLPEGMGRLVLVGWPTELGKLQATPITADGADAPAVQLDDAGRLPPGLYHLSDDTSDVAIVAGRVTTLKFGAPALVVGGRRFVLDDDIQLVSMDDPGGLSFAKATSPDELPLFGDRYLRPGVPVKDIVTLRDSVTQAVLHADLAPSSAESFVEVVKRSLSDHFAIDFDGKVFQQLDLLSCAYHAGDANVRSIGIVLNNALENLVTHPEATPYPAEHARKAEMERNPRGAPVEAVINGAKTRAWGYSEAQYRALAAIVRRLADLFPELGSGPRYDDQAEVAMAALEPPPDGGVVPHWQLEAQRWDPGPAFDFARVEQALASRVPADEAHAAELAPLPSVAAPTAPDADWRLSATWDRDHDAGLEVRGMPNTGAAVDGVTANAAQLWNAPFALIEPGAPAFDDAQLVRLVSGLMRLDQGVLDVRPGHVRISGKAHNAAAKAAAEGDLRDAAPGFAVDSEVVVDAAHFEPGEGRLVVLGAALPTRLTRLDGGSVDLDELGHAPFGNYLLPDGSAVVIRPYRTTTLSAKAASIVLAGKRFALDDASVKVVLSTDPGGLAFPAPEPDPTRDVLALQRELHYAVLGADLSADASSGFAALGEAKARAHFMVDFDGTVFETLDPAAAHDAPHAIDIALNNLMPNLASDPDAPAYPAAHARKAEMDALPRPRSEPMEINGARTQSYGYTAPQYRALAALLRRLDSVFAGMGDAPPRDAKGRVVARALDALPSHGTLARWHVAADAWSPGPGFDWDELQRQLATVPSGATP